MDLLDVVGVIGAGVLAYALGVGLAIQVVAGVTAASGFLVAIRNAGHSALGLW